MNSTNVDEKVKVKKGRVKTGDSTKAKSEVSTGAMVATGLIAAFLGTWAVASLISGLLESGGPLSFLKSWFTAAFGG